MAVLVTGVGLFLSAFFIHLLIWRVRLPNKQTRSLLLIFFGALALWTIPLWLFPLLYSKIGLPAVTLTEYLHTIFLFISLTFAYITTYSGIEVDSPSLVMVMIVKKAGRDGIMKDDFENALTDDILVKPRVRDLVRDNMAYPVNNKYKITRKGVRIARLFIFYRKILKATDKGG